MRPKASDTLNHKRHSNSVSPLITSFLFPSAPPCRILCSGYQFTCSGDIYVENCIIIQFPGTYVICQVKLLKRLKRPFSTYHVFYAIQFQRFMDVGNCGKYHCLWIYLRTVLYLITPVQRDSSESTQIIKNMLFLNTYLLEQRKEKQPQEIFRK